MIDGAGTFGVVEEIQIFTTLLRTPENKTVIIPNAKLTGDNITNFSLKGTLRVDLTIGASYGDDIDRVKETIEEVLKQDDRILDEPPFTVAVVELADSSVNYVVRPWTTVENYWNVYFDTTERIKKRFDAEGISIPFPQRDVHIYKPEE